MENGTWCYQSPNPWKMERGVTKILLIPWKMERDVTKIPLIPWKMERGGVTKPCGSHGKWNVVLPKSKSMENGGVTKIPLIPWKIEHGVTKIPLIPWKMERGVTKIQIHGKWNMVVLPNPADPMENGM
ncbi:hypothetical protein DUI87_29011 [Hirundo rustica rustica]|uniref:Uncharacterized protein n=1 Tax=Hirundo rustica rustica TaxID=333673 RepID=A0A3M0J042_HIRRU|nr:hypothetical protein DUI87_29011 [Hirundo rustica rustica]